MEIENRPSDAQNDSNVLPLKFTRTNISNPEEMKQEVDILLNALLEDIEITKKPETTELVRPNGIAPATTKPFSSSPYEVDRKILELQDTLKRIKYYLQEISFFTQFDDQE